MAEQRLLDILGTLMSFETVSEDTQTLTECLDYIAPILERSGLHVNRYRSGGVPSLVATSQPKRQSKLLLQAHLDVVPGPEHLFELSQRDGKLHGRGTYDMKFAAACFIAAAEALSAEQQRLDYAIMFSCDEEIGGKNGVNYLLNEERYSTEVCFLPDGGDNWAIEERAKGAWFLNASAEGKASHGSRPWEGENAIYKLLNFIEAARQIFPAAADDQPTLVVSKLHGGEAINQVPDYAAAMLDIRFLRNRDQQRLRQELKSLAKEHDINLETETFVSSASLDTTLPVVDTWKSIVEEKTGERPGHCMSLGSSDAHYFTDHGIPTILTRPNGGCPHGPEEWLGQTGFEQYYDSLLAFIRVVAVVK